MVLDKLQSMLKFLTCIVSKRLSKYAEDEGLLPTFQFGYRAQMATVGAASTPYEVINSSLNRSDFVNPKKKSLKPFVAFVDFSKCFDSINREQLFEKLQKMGIPFTFCNLIFDIYHMRCN